jgi:hypothetical protein
MISRALAMALALASKISEIKATLFEWKFFILAADWPFFHQPARFICIFITFLLLFAAAKCSLHLALMVPPTVTDNVAEATGMGESTVRTSFNCFCDNFVTEFYDSIIYRPEGLKLEKMMDV